MAAYVKKGRWDQPMTELHAHLAKCFPEHRTATHDVLDVTWLAKKMKMSREGLYKYLRAGKLSAARARQICAIAGCRKKFETFVPFLG